MTKISSISRTSLNGRSGPESPGVVAKRVELDGQEKKCYEREIESSWRMTMSKIFKNKILVMFVMMLIILVGGSSEVSAAELMGRDNADYMLGAYRADSATTYKAELVTKVIFASTAPSNPVASWDVSDTNGDGEVMSYLVESTEVDGVQYYDQYIVASQTINAKNRYQLFRG